MPVQTADPSAASRAGHRPGKCRPRGISRATWAAVLPPACRRDLVTGYHDPALPAGGERPPPGARHV